MYDYGGMSILCGIVGVNKNTSLLMKKDILKNFQNSKKFLIFQELLSICNDSKNFGMR